MTFGVWQSEIVAKRGQKPQLLFSLRLGFWPSESGTSEIVAKWGQHHSCCSHYTWVCDLRSLAERDSGKAGAKTTAVILITLGFVTFGVWQSEIVAKRGQKPQLLFSLRLGFWPSESGTREIVAKRGQKPQPLFSLHLGLWPSESGTSEIVAKRGQKPQLLFSLHLGLWPSESGRAR